MSVIMSICCSSFSIHEHKLLRVNQADTARLLALGLVCNQPHLHRQQLKSAAQTNTSGCVDEPERVKE